MITLSIMLLWALHGPAFAATCEGPGVKISAVAGDQRNYQDYKYGNVLPAAYGDTIHVYCSGPHVTNLSLSMGHVQQRAITLNSTTLKVTLKGSELRWYDYVCADANSTCEESVTVVVMPTITVESPNVRQQRLLRKTYFFVPIKEDYEVVCLGYPTTSLALFKNKMTKVDTDVYNITMIKSKTLNEKENVFDDYYCYPDNMYFSVYLQKPVRVYVDHPPTATDFWCVEYKERVKCSWNALSTYTTFTLFFTNDDGVLLRLCEDHSSKTTRLCEFSLADIWTNGLEVDKEFKLVLNMCSRLFCANQTFDIRREEIMKPAPPFELKMFSTDPDDVGIGLRDMGTNVAGDFPTSHRVRYRMPAIGPQDYRASISSENTVSNNPFSPSYTSLQIELSCPSTIYELKVYSKYPGSLDGDAYWSDPAVIIFYTDPKNSSEVIDPVCSTETELITNNIIAAYEVKKFARYFRKKALEFNKVVDALKAKRAKFEEAIRTGI